MTRQPLTLTALWKTLRTEVIGRKFVQDVGVLTVTKFVAAALNFVQGILVARWLGPELYGVAALVMAYPGLLYTFFDARSSEASVKYLSEFHALNERERALAMCKLGYAVDFAVASLSFLVVVVTASWAVRLIVGRPEAVGLIIVYAAAFIPRALVGTSSAIMTTFGRFQLIAWIEILMTILRVVLVVGLVLTGWQVAGVVWGNAAAMIATGLLYAFISSMLVLRAWGGSPFRGNWQALKGRRREILGFLAYNDLNVFLGMIQQLDIVLLGYFRNPVEVGYYKLAKNLAGGLSHITNPLQSVTYPRLARLWSVGLLADFRRVLYRLAVGLGMPLMLAVLLSILLAPSLILHFLGEPYLKASYATQLLLAATGLRLIGFWVYPFYLATGQVHLLTIFTLAGAVVAIPAYIGSIWLWGINGLALTRVGLTVVTSTAAGVMAMLWGVRTNSGWLSPESEGLHKGN